MIVTSRIFKIFLVTIFLMNLIDGVGTYLWVVNGYAEEKNPLMDFLIDVDPILFLCIKIIVGTLCVLYFWEKFKIWPLLVPVFLVYSYGTYIHIKMAIFVFHFDLPLCA